MDNANFRWHPQGGDANDGNPADGDPADGDPADCSSRASVAAVGPDQLTADQCRRVLRHLRCRYYPELTIQDLEDIVQEMALKALRVLKAGRTHIRSLYHYVKKAADRTAWKQIDGRRRHRRVGLENDDLAQQAWDGPKPGDAAEYDELVSRLHGEVSGLPDDQRRVIVTYYRLAARPESEGADPVHTVRDTAKALGLSEGQVRGRLHRGIRTLCERCDDLREDRP